MQNHKLERRVKIQSWLEEGHSGGEGLHGKEEGEGGGEEGGRGEDYIVWAVNDSIIHKKI
jgi:hypothetical protein